jgi:hypothetical protein
MQFFLLSAQLAADRDRALLLSFFSRVVTEVKVSSFGAIQNDWG